MHLDTSDRKEQRKFGILMAIAITVLGSIRWVVHGPTLEHLPLYFFIVAGVFLALGLVAPKALEPIFVVWMKFALALNWVMTRVLLTVAFYVMITPVRLIIRVWGEDPLKRAWLPANESYWEPAEEQPKEFERYRNQF